MYDDEDEDDVILTLTLDQATAVALVLQVANDDITDAIWTQLNVVLDAEGIDTFGELVPSYNEDLHTGDDFEDTVWDDQDVDDEDVEEEEEY